MLFTKSNNEILVRKSTNNKQNTTPIIYLNMRYVFV